ncbi:NeuD/PglB/VioB family sugar acetyltransferase [Dokdonia sp. Asnod3-C12]|uniref:NeuD/PglB/VioB family sugar acetyltransferase n=1 Tax=Dokdonia sp. Asnod3-C12 TaxID=3160575 RepID=UPI003864D105
MKIFGASGHGKVVNAIAINNDIVVDGFVDDNYEQDSYLGIPVNNVSKTDKIIIGIGNNAIRKILAYKYEHQWHNALLHKSASVSLQSQIGLGTVVMPHAVINEAYAIGNHCIINTAAVVEHDCIVKDFVHISPNVTLCGGVVIDEGTHVGAGSVVIPGIKIGKWCTIGAGTVVIRDIPDYAVVVGNPGRIIKYNKGD